VQEFANGVFQITPRLVAPAQSIGALFQLDTPQWRPRKQLQSLLAVWFCGAVGLGAETIGSVCEPPSPFTFVRSPGWVNGCAASLLFAPAGFLATGRKYDYRAPAGDSCRRHDSGQKTRTRSHPHTSLFQRNATGVKGRRRSRGRRPSTRYSPFKKVFEFRSVGQRKGRIAEKHHRRRVDLDAVIRVLCARIGTLLGRQLL